jgi:phage baseplate assembly protein W
MKKEFYPIPFPFDRVIAKKRAPKSLLGESVAQNIFLILTTRFGENRFDKSFGSSVWEQDFEILPKITLWKDKIQSSIQESIRNHEPRLTGLQVMVTIDENEIPGLVDKNLKCVKKRIQVMISGNLIKTNERFSYKENIYCSPFSLD